VEIEERGERKKSHIKKKEYSGSLIFYFFLKTKPGPEIPNSFSSFSQFNSIPKPPHPTHTRPRIETETKKKCSPPVGLHQRIAKTTKIPKKSRKS
jgi:hypothetical protein